MIRRLGTVWIGMAFLLGCCGPGLSQTTAAVADTGSKSQSTTAAAQTPAQDASLTDKQKTLLEQTDRLLTMATDLKAQVDKTNKNILSIKVVQKAEEIEQLAHRMKEQAKK